MRSTTTQVLLIILIHLFVLLPLKTTTGRLLGQQPQQEQHGSRGQEGIPRGQHLQNRKRSHGHRHNENDVNNHHRNNNNNNNNTNDKNDNTQDHGEVIYPPESDTIEDEEGEESQMTLPEEEGGQREEENQVEGGQEKDQEGKARDETPEMDCGSFLIRQTDSITIFDDFEEIDASETSAQGMKELSCTELMSGNELCFGGQEETAALWVHGLCFRGRGHTSVTVSGIADDSEIVFACGGSPEATPSVECRSCEMPNNGNDKKGDNHGRDIDVIQDCDFPFRAEARFGILSIPIHSEGRCVLICEMPTTNE